MSGTLRKDHGVLAGLLALQLVLAGITWTAVGRDAAPASGKSTVFEFTADDVTRVDLVGAPPRPGGENSEVTLAREGEGWVVASADGYPARTDKVDELLGKLLDLEVGEAISSNPSSHESLRVGGRTFDRRATLSAGEDSRTVVLGSGQRSSINVRVDGEDDVRVARGATIQTIRADARNYVEAEYVAVEKDDLTRIEVTNEHGTLLFEKSEDGWKIADFPQSEQLDEAAMATYINNVARMTLLEPVGTTVDPSFGLENGAHIVLAGTGDEETVFADYVIGAAADERSYYAKAAGSDFVVKVPKWGAEQIRDKKISDFFTKPEQE